MARVGQVLEHPVTGERLEFVETSDTTDGERLTMRFSVDPGGRPAAPHVHPTQEETFRVHTGVIDVTSGSEIIRVGPGEAATVPTATPHTWVNAGTDEAEMDIVFEPAREMELFFEIFFGLAEAGEVDKKGMPSPLQLALLAPRFIDQVHLARPPLPVQQALFSALRPIARWRGYEAVPSHLDIHR